MLLPASKVRLGPGAPACRSHRGGPASVEKWMKPGRAQFQIEYRSGEGYEPDFVVEMKNRSLIFEVKARNELEDPIVQAKAAAAPNGARPPTAMSRLPKPSRGCTLLCRMTRLSGLRHSTVWLRSFRDRRTIPKPVLCIHEASGRTRVISFCEARSGAARGIGLVSRSSFIGSCTTYAANADGSTLSISPRVVLDFRLTNGDALSRYPVSRYFTGVNPTFSGFQNLPRRPLVQSILL